jgi:PAS domain S-box-containing protein
MYIRYVSLAMRYPSVGQGEANVSDQEQPKRRASDVLGIERFFELSSDLLCIASATGVFLRLSRSWTRVLGWSLEELTARPFIDFIHPEDRSATLQAMGDLADGLPILVHVNRYRTKAGGYRTLSWRSTPTEEDGLVFAVARDITDEAALRAEVDFLGGLVNHSRDPIYCLSPARGFVLTYVNEAACALVGRSRDQIIGQPVWRFDPAMDAERMADIWAKIRNSSVPVMVTGAFQLSGGTTVPVEISASAIHHAGEDYIVGSIRDISVRRAAERQVREREAFYRGAIEATADGFWLTDPAGHILDVNSAYARMSGYSEAELRGMRIADIEALEQADDVIERIARIRNSGSATFEGRHRRKDGSLWDVEVTVIYSDIEGGRCFAFLRDLRRRRRADTLLKARLNLSEVGRLGSVDALMAEVQNVAQRLTASTTGFFRFVEPDPQYPTVPLICNAGPDLSAMPGMPGEDRPVRRLLAVPVRGEDGFTAILGVGDKAADYDQDDLDVVLDLAAIALDIINWVRSEQAQRDLAEALTRTAQQWNAAMDSFQAGIAVIDDQHRLVRANAAFFSLTASRPERRLGKVLHCLTDLDERNETCPLCLDLEKWERRELVLEADAPGNPSGLPLELRLSPIRDGAGQAMGMLLSLYDLTGARDQERRMVQTIAELTRSNAELERFAQVAAHDLQEPTRRQVLYAQLLQRKRAEQIDDETRTYLDRIIEDALKMREMVRGLNDYSQTNRSVVPSEMVDLDRVMLDVRSALYREIETSGAVLTCAPLGEVPGNRSRLQLLMVNLLSNALKFRRPGIAPVIFVIGEAQPAGLTVTVSDNGVGIPEESRTDLFTMFRRLNPHDRAAGPGMGLAQCRRIVEDLGGRIWLEGNESGGTSVRLTLPRPV